MLIHPSAYISLDILSRKRLFARTLSSNKKLFARTLPANKKLFAGTPTTLLLCFLSFLLEKNADLSIIVSDFQTRPTKSFHF